ncbi:MAG: aminopeptidase P N-terminal domain-containing protein [Saccharofermentanales bacterium]
MNDKSIRPETSYFSENRMRFFNELEDNTIVILFSGTAQRKTSDQYYPFEGNHNFYYLTGIEQEGSVLVIKKQNGLIMKLLLCIRANDSYAERWNGIRLSQDEASRISGIHDVTYSESLDGLLKKLLKDWNGSVAIDKDMITGSFFWITDFIDDNYPDMEVKNVFSIFSQLRSIKSAYEVSLMKKAIEATRDGIFRIFRTAVAGMKEYELAAEFEYALLKKGLGEPSFESIVAAGENFNYLHYPQINKTILGGELVLLDVGAYYCKLSSDISRVFPIDGKFTARQRMIYDLVRECQNIAFEMIKPGMYINDINAACKSHVAERICDLGVLSDTKNADKYYWHNISHHLGLDVHDICGRDAVLKEGMVITVEPGVYIPEWGIGLRIEDDVWVTAEGCEIISDCIPREADEIESLLSDIGDMGLNESFVPGGANG